jgi:hypothetical protein
MGNCCGKDIDIIIEDSGKQAEKENLEVDRKSNGIRFEKNNPVEIPNTLNSVPNSEEKIIIDDDEKFPLNEIASPISIKNEEFKFKEKNRKENVGEMLPSSLEKRDLGEKGNDFKELEKNLIEVKMENSERIENFENLETEESTKIPNENFKENQVVNEKNCEMNPQNRSKWKKMKKKKK